MQNALLFTRLQRALAALGFEVLTHTLTPPNDGSISLGQVAVAAARMEREGKRGKGQKAKRNKKYNAFEAGMFLGFYLLPFPFRLFPFYPWLLNVLTF